MKRPIIMASVAFVAFVNLWVLVSVARNRAGAPRAVIEMTERELPLYLDEDLNTAAFLRPEWKGPRMAREFKAGGDSDWLDEAKLRELGFNIGPAVAGPEAMRRFTVFPAREVFVVLEYRAGEPSAAGSQPHPMASRLAPVDAGLDPEILRVKFADSGRHLVVPGIVRASIEREWQDSNRSYKTGRIRGYVQLLSVAQVHVPLPYARVLRGLKPASTSAYLSTEEAKTRGARYAVALAFGRNNEPWVTEVRLLQ
jgi:hypothetical protein